MVEIVRAEYNKPYLPIPDQISLLKSRGLAIADEDQAAMWLRRVGYYRLSGCLYAFRQRRSRDQGGAVEVLDDFQPGTELHHAFHLYVWDKKLRLLFLDAIERIEVGIRVEIALLLGESDPWAHRNPNNFNRYFRSVAPEDLTVRHLRWLTYLDIAAARSREEFVRHFFDSYKDPLPIWIAIELWDFGTLSNLLSGMKDKDLQHLADKYQIPKRTTLASWVQCLNFIRNICAHHGRLWNRPLVVQPSLSKSRLTVLSHVEADIYAKTRLYAAAVITQYLLRTISPNSTWSERLKSHMASFPGGPGIDLKSTGFPTGWQSEAIWQTR